MLSTEYLVMFATWPTSGNRRSKLDKELKNIERNYTLPTFTHRSATHCSGTPRHEPSLIEQHIAQEHHNMNWNNVSILNQHQFKCHAFNKQCTSHTSHKMSYT